LLFIVVSFNSFAYTDFSKINFKFLNAAEASQFLSTSDDFINALTTLDLSLHHSTAQTISIDYQLEFLKHVSLDWTPDEISRIGNEILLLEKGVNSLELNLILPMDIKLIKTTGADEFNSHYTRGNAIIFPIKNRDEGVTTDSPTVFHEIFHIMSRSNPELSDKLYEVCNFKPIPKLIIPKSIQDIALTNPDAFYYQHAITITANGSEKNVIPFFYSALKQSDIKGPVDEAKTFKLGLLDLATLGDEQPKLYKTSETDYKLRAQVNSSYYIHPEEIMAENFRLLIMRATNASPMPPIKFPEILDKLVQVLK
jgi:hypothetical protein